MRLDKNILSSADKLKPLGYELPAFDIDKVRAATEEKPEWVHFGTGNIFRAFIADSCQKLLDEGLWETGIIAAEGFDYNLIDQAYRAFDNLSLLAVLNCDGTADKKITASVTDSLKVSKSFKADWDKLCKIFRAPSLKLVSFTITEKGYSLSCADNSESVIYKLTELCLERFKAGAYPIALVSMDNCSGNGDKLRAAVMKCAEKLNAGEAFESYLRDEAKVSFPCSMIDKITPRPDDTIKAMFEKDDFENMDVIITDKRTYTAPFVNAEKPQYLVIEDKFPAGRPPLEKAGIIFTDRVSVDKAECMKVCTCLNPLHTSLAIFGCLLGYKSISAEMSDELLSRLVNKIGFDEGLPAVEDPIILNPRDFINEVITERLPNKFIPDTPQRIACDTSQKIPIRYGRTIRSYMNSDKLDISKLTFIPLTIAGWARYLMVVDDEGNAFTPSDDPELSTLMPVFEKLKLGASCDVHALLEPILSDAKYFSVNLYEAGIAEKVEVFFGEMICGKGAVRNTLKRYLG